MPQLQTLSGPDFLEAVADAEAANGNHINADAYRLRALQWKQDQAALHNAQTQRQDATDRLADIARTARRASAA